MKDKKIKMQKLEGTNIKVDMEKYNKVKLVAEKLLNNNVWPSILQVTRALGVPDGYTQPNHYLRIWKKINNFNLTKKYVFLYSTNESRISNCSLDSCKVFMISPFYRKKVCQDHLIVYDDL